MAEMPATFRSAARLVRRYRGVILPVAVAAMIFVVLVPLPAMLVDLLLVANIALAAVILLTSLHVGSALELASLPSILLVATLFRLVLNVATTRLILTAGQGARGVADAHAAAGQVIWSFSEFVASGSLTVGVILFAMLIVIQFVVVTKGAARISEVAARFVLDAMPGRQAAIDAEAKAGSIDEAEARQRRARISAEADFYGAMDGASKFLRGDAIAAAVITLVNILGGLYVGIVQLGWTWPQTVGLFARLTIGDGLVTQIPALLISIAAAMIVTRSASGKNLGEEMLSQLTSRPIVLGITGVFLAALTLTSLPRAPLLVLAAACIALAVILTRSRRQVQAPAPHNRRSSPPGQDVRELLRVEAIEIQLGYALVPMADADAGGELLDKVAALRRQIAAELGLIIPPIRIRDSFEIDARSYAIEIRGVKVASGTLDPRRLLATGAGQGEAALVGETTTEPTFGTEATWIDPAQRGRAEAMGYTVVEPDVVLATHLGETVRRRAPALLSRQSVLTMLEHLRPRAGNIVAEAIEVIGLARIQSVLQNLLSERAAIRDIETILESLCEAGVEALGVEAMTEHARAALGPALCQAFRHNDGKVWCVCLDADLEGRIGACVAGSGRDATGAIPGDLGRRLTEAVSEGVARLKQQGRKAVVVCGPNIRRTVRDLVSTAVPEAAVLGYNEIDSSDVQSIGSVGTE